VTQANRQDIVTTSARNADLVDWIAATFVKAMQELCNHDTLRYVWMRYLPHEGDFPWDNYWKSLVAAIKKKLGTTKLLRPRSEQSLQLITKLRRHADVSVDGDGEPIFADVQPEIYLSKQYQNLDLEMLRDYGLGQITMKELLDRVEADLKSSASRIRSPDSTRAWHTKAASLISVAFSQDWAQYYERIRKLQLIPVQNGRWVSADSSRVSLAFPTVNGMDIPSDLDLTLIDQKAFGHPKRKILFQYLGAKQLTVQRVRELILNKYGAVVSHSTLFGTLGDSSQNISLAHLSFLYLTHDPANTDIQSYRWIRVITHDGSLKAPRSQDVYIADDHRYGTKELLRPKAPEDAWPASAQGFPVSFISHHYLEHVPLQSQGHGAGMGWLDWLEKCLGTRTRPNLISEGQLTDLFEYIINHRSGDLLGVLQHYWPWIERDILGSENIKEHLREITVLSRGGRKTALSESYLPYPNLKGRCLEYLGEEDVEKFPFLDLSNTLVPHELHDWDFLHTAFGVGKEENLEFCLEMLRCLGEMANFQDQDSFIRVYDLYERIHSKSRETRDAGIREEQQTLIL
jgi:hypothetical protein